MWVPDKKYWDLIIRNGDELVWGLKGYTGGKKAGIHLSASIELRSMFLSKMHPWAPSETVLHSQDLTLSTA